MTAQCQKVQDLLGEHGPAALKGDQEAQEHLTQCSECFAVLEGMADIDRTLRDIEAYNAPQPCIAGMLEKVRKETLSMQSAAQTAALSLGWASPEQMTGGIFSPIMRWANGIFAQQRRLIKLLSVLCAAAAVILGAISFAVLLGTGLIIRMLALMIMLGTVVMAIVALSRKRLKAFGGFGVLAACCFLVIFLSVNTAEKSARAPGKSQIDHLDFRSERSFPRINNQPAKPFAPAYAPYDLAVGNLDSSHVINKESNESGNKTFGETAEYAREEYKAPSGQDFEKKAGSRSAEREPRPDHPEGKHETDVLTQNRIFKDAALGAGTGSFAEDGVFRSLAPRERAGEEITIDNFVDADGYEQTGERAMAEKEAPLGTSLMSDDKHGLREADLAAAIPITAPFSSSLFERADEDVKSKKTAVAAAPPLPASEDTAALFWSERSRTEGLHFKRARGYWANSYVPGDPFLMSLAAYVNRADRSGLAPVLKKESSPENLARQPSQPFDYPENAALAVFLDSDRAGLLSKSRLLVQVGLQATKRQSGIRPPMNVGVVLDLRGVIDQNDTAKFASLLRAFGKIKDMGDRFSLTIAGKSGAVLIEPDEFRLGAITVALQKLFETKDSTEENVLSLPEAIRRAIETVRSSDDSSAALGSSAILLATGQPLTADVKELAKIAHDSAVSGVPISVISLRDRTPLEDVDRIVLAGQGNRRLLETPDAAEELVKRELSAVSRVVARALRLRIRLAPGVKLVDILGSQQMDDFAAQRARQAEQSIDQRISRNLGIEADRGEDEEGIQIIIPAFYAGDSHVILLDVVAPGPGPIADVRVRYKDLVHLKNGMAQTTLTLTRDGKEPGPLELNVTKNMLAFHLGKTLEQAGAALVRGDRQGALTLINGEAALLEASRVRAPLLMNDPDLRSDLHMLSKYQNVIASGASAPGPGQEFTGNSLQYSGKLKILPRPSIE